VPVTDLTVETINEIFAVNVRSLLLLCARVVPSMIELGGGSIVNLSSITSSVGTPSRAAYAASKGAVDAITRALAQELGEHKIRVNSVAPGIADTQLWARNKSIPGVVETTSKSIPLGRWGTAREVASLIAFLISTDAGYLTAQTIGVDGGMAHTLDLYSGSI